MGLKMENVYTSKGIKSLKINLMQEKASDLTSEQQTSVSFSSQGDTLQGLIITPKGSGPFPVLIITHGAGEFKENYVEMAEFLAAQGIASLALDMHGHGGSGGKSYHISIKDWVADIIAAVDFIATRPELDKNRIGAFGLSSGGTAVLEAALIEPRIKSLVTLDATVMNTLPLSISLMFKGLSFLGGIKRILTGNDLTISLVPMLADLKIASDPEINLRLQSDPGKLRAFANFPLPGATEAFIVDTITRVKDIKIPTLVIWGEDDLLDPITTGQTLHEKLTCTKDIVIVPGNGHAGHLDRNRTTVFQLTVNWLTKHLV